MKRQKYISPFSEQSLLEQESLFCQSYDSADRGIDSLTDAYDDWDVVG